MMYEVGVIIDGIRTVQIRTKDAEKAREFYFSEVCGGAMPRLWIDGRKLLICEAEEFIGKRKTKSFTGKRAKTSRWKNISGY